VQEALVAADVRHQDLDAVVGAAGGAVAGDDLRAGGDRALELAHRAFVVLSQVDLGENAQGEADAVPIDHRAVAADHAGRLHRLHPLPARRRGQADRGSELLHRLARIALQRLEDGVVGAVENDHAAFAGRTEHSFSTRSLWRQRKKRILCFDP
jgi:hypothetical protein